MAKRSLEIEKYLIDIRRYNAEEANIVENEKEIIISINLTDDDYYKKYSNNNLLEDEVYEFIDECVKLNGKKVKRIVLNLEFPENTTEDEKQKVAKIIKTHYALSFTDCERKARRYNLMSFSMVLLGALFLAGSIVLSHFDVPEVIQEITSIFGWVFICEAGDEFFFRKTENNIERIKALMLFNAKIEI